MLVEKLSSQLGLRVERLEYFASTASKRYYIYTIDKRDGGKRWIAHPSRALKLLQRWMNSRVIAQLQVHEAAKAYRRGVSIRDNASAHATSSFTLRVDFKDFFPSFKSEHVSRFIKDNYHTFLGWNDQDTAFFVQIVCRFGALTIGAPSSPMLTNAMMYDFDDQMSNFCHSKGMIYTRYADDIFVSANQSGLLSDALTKVRQAAQAFKYADLRINEGKTAFLSRRYRRRITGLIVTPDGQISLGRDRKRELKALIHKLQIDQLPTEKHEYLKGLLAFAQDADRPFYKSLYKKYDRSTLDSLFGSKSGA